VQAQHLAVHVQDRPALVVGDVGVLAEAEEALADQVHGSTSQQMISHGRADRKRHDLG
jgi:hypothetical protein